MAESTKITKKASEEAGGYPDAGLVIRTAAAEADSQLGEIAVDPREHVRAANKRATEKRFPSAAREQAAAGELRHFVRVVAGLILRFDYSGVLEQIGNFERRIEVLAAPEPPRTFAQELEAGALRGLQQASWSSEEIDGICRFWCEGDSITDFGASFVKLGARRITRAEIRETLLPVWSRERSHLKVLEQIEHEAVLKEAEDAQLRTADERQQRGGN